MSKCSVDQFDFIENKTCINLEIKIQDTLGLFGFKEVGICGQYKIFRYKDDHLALDLKRHDCIWYYKKKKILSIFGLDVQKYTHSLIATIYFKYNRLQRFIWKYFMR